MMYATNIVTTVFQMGIIHNGVKGVGAPSRHAKCYHSDWKKEKDDGHRCGASSVVRCIVVCRGMYLMS